MGGLGAWFLALRSSQAQCGEVANVLHRRLDIERLARLHIWDSRDLAWRAPRPEERLSVGPPVQVLHLWADWCAPCLKEMPLVQRLAGQLNDRLAGKARLVCVAEIPNAPDMERYLKAQRGRMPPGPHYQDTAELLASALRPLLPAGRWTLPFTLILDPQRVIRHAIIGALAAHLVELLPICERLVDLARA